MRASLPLLRLSFFLLVLSSLYGEISALNILSFNVRQFGMTKYSKQPVIDTLIKIVQKYDLILILELVDVSQTVLPGFVNQLNQNVTDQGLIYNYSLSERVGRSNNKEQYVFIYRVDAIQVLNTYQYPDSGDVFERPPYAVLVRSINRHSGDLPSFFLIAIHTKPTDTVAELNHLDDVFRVTSIQFSTQLGMILGDLNADCSYLSQTRYNTLDLVLNTSFTWWIGNDIDTTTGASECAYDRIITYSDLSGYVVNNSARVVLFDSQYNLTSSQTTDVSDHYPVEITLQGSPFPNSSTRLNCLPALLLFLLLIAIA